MKNIFIKKIIALAFFTLSAHVFADPVLDLVGQIADGEPASKICRKGAIEKGQFSIRSLKGAACRIPFVAAFAQLVCGDKKDFVYSHCNVNSKRVLVEKMGMGSGLGRQELLGLELDRKMVQDQFIDELKSLGKFAVVLVCSGSIPLVSHVCKLFKLDKVDLKEKSDSEEDQP